MSSSQLLSISTFVFALAAFFYLAALIFRRTRLTVPARWTVLAAVLVTTAGLLLRWVESYQMGIGHAPLSNLYESLVFFSWTAGVIYLFLEFKYKNALIGAFVTPIVFLAMAYASMSPNISDRIQPLVPALKSNWLIAHVATCFFGYAAFAIAFGMSIMYLIKARDPEKGGGIIGHIPKLDVLDELTHQMVLFGFLFLTGGIITGAVWANSAWGSYWSWDPKETWSLITWFIYASLLHARLMRGWQGKQIAYLSLVGFAAVLFTYFGVNLLPGLHSYGKV
ncbi:c-type cytochrome biogenesis protein CcsB [Desulfosarcina alkanivorans]|jgi:cytochrome c-type biogenesis protein CcsB|uniref:Heme exporter protein C n=1 Tax=Desulfosarcina alkanivorans TaxID=571177 RepID=A0A5K7YGY2_9BACT|nr:c-type cytochrome biogenesis protein CcsB [Desulfosarcina alkanivorans]BBO68872.1 c-type cytochrome biogenesis protein CcsB [Desulfosarcina alkanivorans]